MKLTSLLALGGGALCIISLAANAAPAPKSAPSTTCAPDTNGVDLMEMFVRVPDYVFRFSLFWQRWQQPHGFARWQRRDL